MRIYLDWDVINKMRCAKEDDDVFLKLRTYLLETKGFHVIPCSGAHLSDLSCSNNETHRDEVEKDLTFLEELTWGFSFVYDTTKNVEDWSSNHLRPWYEDVVASRSKFFQDGKYIENFGLGMPFGGLMSSMLNSLKNVPSGIPSEQLDLMRNQDFAKLSSFFERSAGGSLHDLLSETVNLMQSFNNDDSSYRGVRNEFREKYKLHGSYDDENVIRDMEEKLKMVSKDLSFDRLITSVAGSVENPDHFKQFTTQYLMLDFFGYKTDKRFKNMVQDATHAFNAAFCDMYISVDSRARAKSKAVYNHLSIRTEVASPEDFVNVVMPKIIGPEQNLSSVLVNAIDAGPLENNVDDEGNPVSIFELPNVYGFFNRLQVNYNSKTDYSLCLYRKKRNMSEQVLYREIHQIVDLLHETIGNDVHDVGLYNEEDKSAIEQDNWQGRMHLWNQDVIHLRISPPPIGLMLQILPIDLIRKLASDSSAAKQA